jgi:hypothetical protein
MKHLDEITDPDFRMGDMVQYEIAERPFFQNRNLKYSDFGIVVGFGRRPFFRIVVFWVRESKFSDEVPEDLSVMM